MSAVLCCAGGKGKAVSGSVIRATIPYVKADIPILVLFRALGTVVSTAAAAAGACMYIVCCFGGPALSCIVSCIMYRSTST